MKKVNSEYTVSVNFDQRLYEQDITGSIAHVEMLAKQQIISDSDSSQIVSGLLQIRDEIESSSFKWDFQLEDLHMNIENRLHEIIGPVAGKMHTARSRNDQVSLDLRMYVKESITKIHEKISRLQMVLIQLAELNLNTIIPGYTHLQQAQPVLFSHHMLAYFEMLTRDDLRFKHAYAAADVLPLGSGALAGVPYPINREIVAQKLGFSRISQNSMDAVSDRDFLIDFLSSSSILMMHLSRFSEEIIIWSSTEFGFVELSEDFSTGSSIMPQKRNPDFAELARGKTGRVFGSLFGLLTVLKGLPLTYNRDLQEDKEGFFDTLDTINATLEIFIGMIGSIKVKPNQMRNTALKSQLLATDYADYLVGKGLPFREAYGIINKLSSYAIKNEKDFSEISLKELKKFSTKFDQDINEISLESSIENRNVFGGTSQEQVKKALATAKAQLKENK